MDIAKQTLKDWAAVVVLTFLYATATLTLEERKDKRPPPFLVWGAAGLGKSSAVRQIVKKLSELTEQPWGLIDVRLVQFDAVDLRGCPIILNSKTIWATSAWLPDEKRDGKYGVLFLDELFLSQPSVQAAALQLALDRRIGDYELPDGWYVCAASNRPSDKAGIGFINAALCDRWEHREIIVSTDAWVEYAIDKGLREEVIAFIRFRGENNPKENKEGLLLQYPNGVPKGQVAFSTPRSWEWVSNKLDQNLPHDFEAVSIEGLVGKGPAAEFVGFLNIWRKVGDFDLDSIINDPENADLPTEPETVYAFAGLLGRKATKENLGAFITFLNRASPEYAIKAVRDAVQRNDDLKCSKAYLDFKVKFIDINIAA